MIICLSCCFSFLGTERSAASAPSKHFQANIRYVPSGLAAMRGVFVGLSFCCVLKTFALRCYPSAALLSKRFKVLCCYEIQADFMTIHCVVC